MPDGKTGLVLGAQLVCWTCAANPSWGVWPVERVFTSGCECPSVVIGRGGLRVEEVKRAGPTLLSQQHYGKSARLNSSR